jgi:hypothetical protein
MKKNAESSSVINRRDGLGVNAETTTCMPVFPQRYIGQYQNIKKAIIVYTLLSVTQKDGKDRIRNKKRERNVLFMKLFILHLAGGLHT